MAHRVPKSGSSASVGGTSHSGDCPAVLRGDTCAPPCPLAAASMKKHALGCRRVMGSDQPCTCNAPPCPPAECLNAQVGANACCAGDGCSRAQASGTPAQDGSFHIQYCQMLQPGVLLNYCSEDCAKRYAHGPECAVRWCTTAECSKTPLCKVENVTQAYETHRNELAQRIAEMLLDVERFNQHVTALPASDQPRVLSKERLGWSVTALREEVDEFDLASQQGKVDEAADGLVDLVYFALGRLYEMGVPAQAVWNGVHAANMAKQRGELSKRPGSLGHDAVKPPGWQPPDHKWLLSLRLNRLQEMLSLSAAIGPSMPASELVEAIPKAKLWDKVSPIIKQAMELREKKGSDYNNIPGGRDAYWVFGDYSFAQMMWTKALRLISLVKGRSGPNFESMRDTIVDMVNYLCFWGEDLNKREQDKNRF